MANPKLLDGREFSESAWYSVDIVKFSQRVLADFDDFLSFVSSASNPAQILHRVVPILAFLIGPQAALKVLVAYVAADVSNLALKWPLQGDRPFWMDESVRQFGAQILKSTLYSDLPSKYTRALTFQNVCQGNTCEVGFGMPSGHVQVTKVITEIIIPQDSNNNNR
jgi:hypothetical protein